MNLLRAIAAFVVVAVVAPGFGAEPSQEPHVGGSRVALASSYSTFKFRTDINPALRYYQAFLEMPNLPEADHQELFTKQWRSQPLDKRFGELVSRYDVEFRFLREAARAEVPCDWGIDLTEGPDALLPGLARAKAAAQVSRLRVMWHLQNGRQAEARDDLLAAFTLGRNVSRDGVLVSALVQIAIENITESVILENFFQLQPETLQQIVDGMDAAPARGTIAQCIPAERLSFHDWLLRKVQELPQESPGDATKTLERLSELFARVGGEAEPDKEFAARVIKAGGGTAEGVLGLIRELAPMYDKVTELMNLPHGPFEEQLALFMAEVDKHPNPLVPKLFKVFAKCRTREFSALVRQVMLRAGVEYKLHGEAGLRKVADPYGNGPFTMRRFTFEGVARGFEIKSAFNGAGYDEALIFLEKGDLPIYLDGKNAGKPLPDSK